MEKVGVIIPTYNRRDIAVSCITYLRHRVNGAELQFYVGVDGTDDTAVVLDGWPSVVVVENKPRLGLGANLNNLLRTCEEDYIIQMDDDHILMEPLDLTEHIKQLKEHEDAGWIRLYGIGSHKYTADLRGSYWYVHWDSPELYIPSNRPHIKHRRFHEFFGWYPEGLKLGQTEEGFCHKCVDMAKEMHYECPHVLVPLNSNSESAFQHVGDSWQLHGE